VYFLRLPDIRTSFPRDQQSHQSGVHHQGSTPHTYADLYDSDLDRVADAMDTLSE